jgi:iron complex outermembrane receptor protein
MGGRSVRTGLLVGTGMIGTIVVMAAGSADAQTVQTTPASPAAVSQAPAAAAMQEAAPSVAPLSQVPSDEAAGTQNDADAPNDAVSAQQPVQGSDIVVTGTRVIRDGYQAPTPTTVLGEEQIAQKAPANLADFVNELPSLAASNTPRANVGFVSAGLVGINALNLRNLGANRTLVLLDGQRIGASTLTGFVDVNNIPQALVKRVDVVTGGASAEWGSDAVAGVVNFVLDKDFTGLKGLVQGGVTTYGDDRNYNVQLTAGTKFADGRGHFLISGEIQHNDGIRGIGDRSWYNYAKLFINPAYNATANNTVPQLIVAPGSGFATATPGGIITSGPLRGTYFGPNGTPAQFNYGSVVSGNFMQGGDYRYSDFGTSGDLDARLSRQGVFSRVGFEVTPRVELFLQGSYNRSTSRQGTLNQFNFGNITIQPDNAFIPAAIAGQITAPFQLGTLNGDLGPILATSKRDTWRIVAGGRGDFDALGSKFTWDAYAQKSINDVYTDARLTISSRYAAAIDSVRNANGTIVCRSTLTNPGNGCVPYNAFGTGVVSQAARDYVLGTSFGRSHLTQDVYAATLRGDPLSTWAGPVSVAVGYEHRREAVSGSNDVLRTTNYAAGLPAPYFAGNYLASRGSYNVDEAFLEAVVPLAKDLPFAKTLDLNGAVRATDYSVSGYVTTWKVGLTYSPIDDLTFRFTRSRDIRAPNLAELFQSPQSSTTNLVDPTRNNTSVTAFQVTSGNLSLDPEKADTLGVGIVLKPRVLPGFAASLDYYDIRIDDSISTITAQALVSQCALGNTIFCSQITRGTTGATINGLFPIASVAVLPVNVAKQISRGLDMEASYRRPVLGGDLTLRVLATRYIKNYNNDGITPATDTVGTNGTNGTLKNSLPKWRYIATVAYDRDPLALSLTARGFSAGVYNTSYVSCSSGCPVSTTANMTINDNRLPGAIYFDGNITVKVNTGLQAFLAVDNIGNRDPYQTAFGPGVGTAPLSVNPLLWDVLGRTFRAGFRFKL